MIRKPTHIPDGPNQFLNIFDFSLYIYTILPPIDDSGNNLVVLNYNIISSAAPLSPKRIFWHFKKVNCVALRHFFAVYSWCELRGYFRYRCKGKDRNSLGNSQVHSVFNEFFSHKIHGLKKSVLVPYKRENRQSGMDNSPSPITLSNFRLARKFGRHILRQNKRAIIKKNCSDVLRSSTDVQIKLWQTFYANDSSLHSSTNYKSASSFASGIVSRFQLLDSILSDLDGISQLDRPSLAKINSLKTRIIHHLFTYLCSKTTANFPGYFDGCLV